MRSTLFSPVVLARKTSYTIHDLRVLHKTRTHSRYALIFGGKIIACPAVDWQATGGEKLFTNYDAFSFPCLFCFIFFFAQIQWACREVKGKGVLFTSCKFACIEGKCQMVTLKVNETEYSMKKLRRSRIIIHAGLQRWNNFSYHLKAKFNDCLIIHSKYFQVLNTLTSL